MLWYMKPAAWEMQIYSFNKKNANSELLTNDITAQHTKVIWMRLKDTYYAEEIISKPNQELFNIMFL